MGAALLIAPAGAAQSPATEVRSTLDAWVRMWTRYDLSQVDKLFVADSSVTYFSSEREGLLRGIADLCRHHEGFGFVPGGKEQPNRLWLEELQITAVGADAAIATATWYFAGGGATDPPQRGPVTFVLVRRGDRYRIAHAHFANYPARAPEPSAPAPPAAGIPAPLAPSPLGCPAS
jgi:hypothetical protein